MDIKNITDSIPIPEEYINGILSLLQSNNVDNWNLIYQLFKSIFGEYNLSDAEFYFRRLMLNYRTYEPSFDLMINIQIYLKK